MDSNGMCAICCGVCAGEEWHPKKPCWWKERVVGGFAAFTDDQKSEWWKFANKKRKGLRDLGHAPATYNYYTYAWRREHPDRVAAHQKKYSQTAGGILKRREARKRYKLKKKNNKPIL